MLKLCASLLAVALLAACDPPPVVAPRAVATSVDGRRAQLRDVIAEHWEYVMRTSPEWASELGDTRYNDRWSDYSDAFARADLDAARGFVARLTAIDTTGFPAQDKLDQVLLVRQLQEQLDGAPFERWLMPVTQFGGPHVDLPSLVPSLPFASVKDYDDYLARLHAVPAVLAQCTAVMRAGLAKRLVPPKILLAKVVDQIDAVAQPAPADSAFATPLATFPAAIPEAERARIRAAVLAAIRDEIIGVRALRERSCAPTTRRSRRTTSACGRCPTATRAIATRCARARRRR